MLHGRALDRCVTERMPHAIEALLMGDLERRTLSEIISIDVLAARNRPVRQNVMPPLGAAEGSGGDVR
jgi:hypothetical protein